MRSEEFSSVLNSCVLAPKRSVSVVSGIVKEKMLPRSGTLSTHILPPCASTASLQKVNPNPVKKGNGFIVECNYPGEAMIALYDNAGKFVSEHKFRQKLELNTNSLAAGLYHYKVMAGELIRNGKLVVE